MKINIKPEDCRYVINEEQRKVVCIIENTENLLYRFIELPLHIKMSMPNKLSKMLLLPNRFTGVATCAPEDEWNVEIGKVLAFSRAKHKVGVSFFKRANVFVNEVDQWLTDMVNSINDYGKRLEKNQNKRCAWLSEQVGCEITLNSKPNATEETIAASSVSENSETI